MMLNRDNYEMYFLLYIDNELDAEQRREVEDFIVQHPDLAIELTDLQNTLPADDTPMAFPDKELLYRGADTTTDLLLYIDGELSAAERAAVEKACAESPEIQMRLQQLQQAVLPQESIVFGDKESLYRHERGRVVPLFYKRALVAAALACVAAAGWWLLERGASQPSLKDEGALAVIDSIGGKDAPGGVTGSSDKTMDTQKDLATGQGLTAQRATKPGQNDVVSKRQGGLGQTEMPSQRQGRLVQTEMPDQQQGELVQAGIPSQKQGGLVQAGISSKQQERLAQTGSSSGQQKGGLIPTEVSSQQPEILARAGGSHQAVVVPETQRTLAQLPEQTATTSTAAVAVISPAVQQASASITKPAVYKELDMTEEGNESLYIGNLELNKNKLAGIFRRAGRLFGNKASNTEKNL